jgi:hypothetical protein
VCVVDVSQSIHEVVPFPYKPVSVQKHEAELERQRLARVAEEEYLSRKAYLQEKGMHDAATTIQRVWRGHRVRKPLRELLGSPTEMAKHRLRDQDARRTLVYIVRNAGLVAVGGCNW